MRVTQEAVTLAQSLLRGWQVEQAVTQVCLTQWQQTFAMLEITVQTMYCQAETHRAQRAQLRRMAWWAFLAGVCLTGLVALGAWHLAPPPCALPAWQTLRPMPVVRERARPVRPLPGTGPPLDGLRLLSEDLRGCWAIPIPTGRALVVG